MPERFGEQFLHQQDDELHLSEAVEHEKERKELAEEKTSQKPAEKIADWLELLKKTHTGHRDNPEVAERIKEYYHQEHVIKKEDVPESTFLLEQKIAREMGHGDIEITDEFREKKTEEIINGQKQSLDKWIDYLTSPDADVYPTWAKYWAFTSMVKMGKLEKKADEQGNETAQFKRRTQDTVAAFPPMNPRALAMTFGVIAERAEQKSKPKKERVTTNKSTKLDEAQFKELLSTENFSKIYSQFLIEMPEYSTEGLQETRGKWITYPQGSEPDKLCKSLEGHPLEWCTANPDTARTQLQGGDFMVYYSYSKNDEPEKPSIPRLAIRMEGSHIAEVRGIAPDQNTDPYIAPVVAEKMKEFGEEGKIYEKRSSDMNQLRLVGLKMENGKELTKEELRFLYEVDGKIEGFAHGNVDDPRVNELREKRDIRQDLVSALDIEASRISLTKDEFLRGDNIFFHYGDLNLDEITSLEDFAFPENVSGELSMGLLRYIRNLKFPKKLGGNLMIDNVDSIEDSEFPESVGGSIYMSNLRFGSNVKLSKNVGGSVHLGGLYKKEGLELPTNKVGGDIFLNSLSDTDELDLPENVGGAVHLIRVSLDEKEELKKRYPNLKII